MLTPQVYDTTLDPAVGSGAASVKIGAATSQTGRTGLRADVLEILFQALTAKDAVVRYVSSI